MAAFVDAARAWRGDARAAGDGAARFDVEELARFDDEVEALHARHAAESAAGAAGDPYDADVHYPRLLRVRLVWGEPAPT